MITAYIMILCAQSCVLGGVSMIGYGERLAQVGSTGSNENTPRRRCFCDGKDPKMRSVPQVRTPVSSVQCPVAFCLAHDFTLIELVLVCC